MKRFKYKLWFSQTQNNSWRKEGEELKALFSFRGLTCFSLDWGNSLGKGEHFSDTGFEDISQRVLWYVKDLLKFTKALGLFKCASVYSHWAIVLESAPSGWVPELPKCWTVFFFLLHQHLRRQRAHLLALCHLSMYFGELGRLLGFTWRNIDA